jgi:hypothetical protein
MMSRISEPFVTGVGRVLGYSARTPVRIDGMTSFSFLAPFRIGLQFSQINSGTARNKMEDSPRT